MSESPNDQRLAAEAMHVEVSTPPRHGKTETLRLVGDVLHVLERRLRERSSTVRRRLCLPSSSKEADHAVAAVLDEVAEMISETCRQLRRSAPAKGARR
jgi:hypothetical protein